MQPTHDNGHKTKNIQDTKYIKFNLQILVQAVEWVRGGAKCSIQTNIDGCKHVEWMVLLVLQ